MKQYISLIVFLIFCLFLDVYAVKGLGTELVPSFKREFLYQSFTGSVLDWVGLVIVNILWLATGWVTSVEKEVYAKSPIPYILVFLGGTIGGLLLIYVA